MYGRLEPRAPGAGVSWSRREPKVGRKTAQLGTFLTVAQLAELLQVPQDTIYYWRSQGKGPRGVKIGRYVRFPESDVEAWLELLAEK
jgi:excisionase family DNA binding protein